MIQPRYVLQVIRSYDRSPVFLVPRGNKWGHRDCVCEIRFVIKVGILV
ncbi:hypothetical protein LINGRAHAP2_LOCUS23639, partial [Linum grandiflorum]